MVSALPIKRTYLGLAWAWNIVPVGGVLGARSGVKSTLTGPSKYTNGFTARISMSSTSVERVANSGPSARDYEQERLALLVKADAAASAAAAIDTDAAVAMSLQRNSVAADDALQRVSAEVKT